MWETVIGLEVHVQLKTNSKLFSGTSTTYGAMPNSQTSYYDAALPGTLPVLNREVINLAIKFGLAVDAKIHSGSYFERKNYFYHDLPKGYQISQFQKPIVSGGQIEIKIDKTTKKIPLLRAHLEEDAGKSIHDAYPQNTAIDLNRAGTPLLEIVTTPCLSNAEEAVAYLKKLHHLVRFIEISDGNMQEGSFRCDVNLSIRPKGEQALGVRTEIKNLNSFRFIEKAIQFEETRQQELLESGQAVIQETRLFSPDTNSTYPMRSKENDFDYRYFPDPDLLPVQISETDIADIKAAMPPLPAVVRHELSKQPELKEEDIEFIISTPATVSYFYAVKNKTRASSKLIANWLKGSYATILNETGLTFATPPISSDNLAELLNYLADNKISNSQAKSVFTELLKNSGSIDNTIKQMGFDQNLTEDELKNIVSRIISNHPKQVEDFRNGKEKLLAFFVGQVMKETRGQANPEKTGHLVQTLLLGKN